jgi:hypothetical protein
MELLEPVLANGAAVTAGSLYLANIGPGGTFQVVKAAAGGLVSDLKTATGATIIRACDAPGRATGAFIDTGGAGGRNIFD